MSDLPKVPGLFRRKQSAQWQYRRRVPAKLQPVVGKTEIVKSLGTTDYRKAAELAGLENVDTDRQFRLARDQLEATERFGRLQARENLTTTVQRRAGRPRSIPEGPLRSEIDDIRLKQIAYSWLLELEGKAKERLEAADARSDDDIAEELANVEIDEADLQNGIATGRLAFTSLTARRLLLENGFDLAQNDGAFGRVRHFIARAWLEHTRRMRRRLTGGWDGTPFDEMFVSDLGHSSPVKPVSAARSFAAVVEEYVNRPQRRVRGKTRNDYERLVRMIEDAFGSGVTAEALSRERCKEFQSLVSRLPANAGKLQKLRNLPIRKAVDRAAQLGLKPMSKKTTNKYVADLSTILKFAVQEGYILSNPGQGLMMPITSRDRRNARRAFSIEQLKAIFGGLSELDRREADKGRSWAAAVALLSGMRSGEILQLETADIGTVDGVDVFHIRESDEPDDLDPDLDFDEEGKRVKTEAGRRAIPIHRELIRKGFLDFVRQQRDRGSRPFVPQGDAEQGRVSVVELSEVVQPISRQGGRQGAPNQLP